MLSDSYVCVYVCICKYMYICTYAAGKEEGCETEPSAEEMDMICADWLKVSVCMCVCVCLFMCLCVCVVVA